MAKNLSIRKMPIEIEKAIQLEAKRCKTTKTNVVLAALREVFRLERPVIKVRRDVRKFFGKMTMAEYREFEKATKSFSHLDEEMWK